MQNVTFSSTHVTAHALSAHSWCLTAQVHLPYISDENADEDPEVKITTAADGPAYSKMRELMVNKGRKVPPTNRVDVLHVCVCLVSQCGVCGNGFLISIFIRDHIILEHGSPCTFACVRQLLLGGGRSQEFDANMSTTKFLDLTWKPCFSKLRLR